MAWFELPISSESQRVYGLSMLLSCGNCAGNSLDIRLVRVSRRFADRINYESLHEQNISLHTVNGARYYTVLFDQGVEIVSGDTYLVGLSSRQPVTLIDSIGIQDVGPYSIDSAEIPGQISLELVESPWNAPAGGISIIDLTKIFTTPSEINEFSIHSLVDDNEIQLKIWRKNNEHWATADESEIFLAHEGWNTFKLSNPIRAKAGDAAGFYSSLGQISRWQSTAGSKVYQTGNVKNIPQDSAVNDNEAGYAFEGFRGSDQQIRLRANAPIRWVGAPKWGYFNGVILSQYFKHFPQILHIGLTYTYLALALFITALIYLGRRFYHNRELLRVYFTGIGAASLAFVLYLLTLAPDLIAGEGGEIQRALIGFEDIHAPGYPLFLLLGKLFLLFVPDTNVFYNTNLFSALCSAFGLGIFAMVVQLKTNKIILSVLSSLALGTTLMIWNWAVVAQTPVFLLTFQSLILFSLVVFTRHKNFSTFTKISFTALLASIAHYINAIPAVILVLILTIVYFKDINLNFKRITWLVLGAIILVVGIYSPLILFAEPVHYQPLYTTETGQFQLLTENFKPFVNYLMGQGEGGPTRRANVITGFFAFDYFRYIPAYVSNFVIYYNPLLFILGLFGMLLYTVKQKLTPIAIYFIIILIFITIFTTSWMNAIYHDDFKNIGTKETSFMQIPLMIMFSLAFIVSFTDIGDKKRKYWPLSSKNTSVVLAVLLVVIIGWNIQKNWYLADFSDRFGWSNYMETVRTKIVPGTKIFTHIYTSRDVLAGYYDQNFTQRDFYDQRFETILTAEAIHDYSEPNKLGIYRFLPVVVDSTNIEQDGHMLYLDQNIDEYYLHPVKTDYRLRFIVDHVANWQQWQGEVDRSFYYVMPKTLETCPEQTAKISAVNFLRHRLEFLNNWTLDPKGKFIRPDHVGIVSNFLVCKPDHDRDVKINLQVGLKDADKRLQTVNLIVYFNDEYLTEVQTTLDEEKNINLTIPNDKMTSTHNILSFIPQYNGENTFYPSPYYDYKNLSPESLGYYLRSIEFIE